MSDDENIYFTQRLEKAQKLRSQGLNPYPNDIAPAHLCADLAERYSGMTREQLEAEPTPEFTLAGRVIFYRSFGKAGFLKIRDRSGEMQVFCEKKTLTPEEFGLYEELDVGDFVFVKGPMFRTKTNELSVKAHQFRIATKSLRNLPEKWHGLTDVETRYRQRYVDLISNPLVKKTFETRSKVINALRAFLISREYIEVETPMMHPIPGGAAAKPFVTHHNALDMDLFLRIAPELYLKRLVVGGFERVFEINRNFRNEGISIQHNPEFTMLEFYQSYATYEDLMTLTEEMLGKVAFEVTGSHQVPYQGETISWAPPFRKIGLVQSLIDIAGLEEVKINDLNYLKAQALKHGFEPRGTEIKKGHYQTFLFETMVEKKLMQPTFVTHFPVEVSPLSRRNDKNPEIADRFELYVYGREIANAFSELNDPVDQKERFLSQVAARESGDDEAMYFDADYIRALEYGMPPTAGEGIGVDRLVMLFADAPSIRDVILFPHMRQAAS